MKKGGETDIITLLQEGAWQALLVWLTLWRQVGYSSMSLSKGDAANLLAGMERYLFEELRTVACPIYDIDRFLKPLWRIYGHWEALVPTEYRLPVPELLVLALIGWALSNAEWLLLLFSIVYFHSHLRPGEALALKWWDIWINMTGLHVFGVIRISRPKTKTAPLQHVLIELRRVATAVLVLKAIRGGHNHDQIFHWTIHQHFGIFRQQKSH